MRELIKYIFIIAIVLYLIGADLNELYKTIVSILNT